MWVLCSYGLGAIAGNWASGQATDRLGGTRVLLAGFLAMAAALVVLVTRRAASAAR